MSAGALRMLFFSNIPAHACGRSEPRPEIADLSVIT
jgi:hypothetical protein